VGGGAVELSLTDARRLLPIPDNIK